MAPTYLILRVTVSRCGRRAASWKGACAVQTRQIVRQEHWVILRRTVLCALDQYVKLHVLGGAEQVNESTGPVRRSPMFFPYVEWQLEDTVLIYMYYVYTYLLLNVTASIPKLRPYSSQRSGHAGCRLQNSTTYLCTEQFQVGKVNICKQCLSIIKYSTLKRQTVV